MIPTKDLVGLAEFSLKLSGCSVFLLPVGSREGFGGCRVLLAASLCFLLGSVLVFLCLCCVLWGQVVSCTLLGHLFGEYTSFLPIKKKRKVCKENTHGTIHSL